jgi:C-terminal processing protease CtpA/Prc
MKIIAIDGVPVTDLRRDDLVTLLFEREAGTSLRLLILSRSLGLLPIFVDLVADRVPVR